MILRKSSGATQEILFKGLENGLNQPIVPDTSAASSNSMPPTHTESDMPEQPSPQSEINRAIQQMQENKDQYLQNMGVSAAEGGYEVTSRTPAALRNRLGLRPRPDFVFEWSDPVTRTNRSTVTGTGST